MSNKKNNQPLYRVWVVEGLALIQPWPGQTFTERQVEKIRDSGKYARVHTEPVFNTLEYTDGGM